VADSRFLSDLKPGESSRVVRMHIKGPLQKKLLSMGVLPGTEVRVIKLAPLGDPVEITLKGYNLSLRREEARGIEVQGANVCNA
jgi:ferrous iron transport protein A